MRASLTFGKIFWHPDRGTFQLVPDCGTDHLVVGRRLLPARIPYVEFGYLLDRRGYHGGSERILVVGWLAPACVSHADRRVNHQTLSALLAPVVDLNLPLLATLSDKQGCVRKALAETWSEVPHQWCQSHYLGNVTRPIYERDRSLKTELRKTIRKAVREDMQEVLCEPESSAFSP